MHARAMVRRMALRVAFATRFLLFLPPGVDHASYFRPHRFWIDTSLECARRDHTPQHSRGDQRGPFLTARALGMALGALHDAPKDRNSRLRTLPNGTPEGAPASPAARARQPASSCCCCAIRARLMRCTMPGTSGWGCTRGSPTRRRNCRAAWLGTPSTCSDFVTGNWLRSSSTHRAAPTPTACHPMTLARATPDRPGAGPRAWSPRT